MSSLHFAATMQAGTPIGRLHLTDLAGQVVQMPDDARLVHLQFRRFAGCPVCNLHLHSFARRHTELADANIHEVVVFHSSASDLQAHAAGLPFTLIADPDKQLYARFGVNSALRALLHPRVWKPIYAAIVFAVREIAGGRARVPSVWPAGGRWGLPADFLVGTDGRLIAAKYGQHANDHWSVDDALALALTRPAPLQTPLSRHR